MNDATPAAAEDSADETAKRAEALAHQAMGMARRARRAAVCAWVVAVIAIIEPVRKNWERTWHSVKDIFDMWGL
jgi:hypothetical protein